MHVTFILLQTRLKVAFIPFLLFIVLGLQGQPLILEPVVKKYGPEQGLPSSEVYMSIQDKQGYVWFATQRGVARFDGQKFEIFTTQQGLCDNSVLVIHEDYKGRIWFLTYSNQISYFHNNKIHSISANAKLRKLYGLNVPCSLGIDSSDHIWIGFRRYSNKGDMIKISPDGSLKQVAMVKNGTNVNCNVRLLNTGDYVWSIGLDSKDQIMAYKKGTQKVQLFSHPTFTSTHVSNNYVKFSLDAHQKNRFVYTIGNGIYRFENGIIEPVQKFDIKQTLGIYEDRDANIWVASYRSGLKKFSKSQNIESFLVDRVISSINQDKEGGIWLCTLNDGVLYLPNSNAKKLPVNQLDNKRISKITGKPGSLILNFFPGGSIQLTYDKDLSLNRGELIKSDGQNNSFILKDAKWDWLSSQHGNEWKLAAFKNNKRIKIWDLRVYFFTQQSKNEVLLLTNAGFHILNLQTEKLKYITASPNLKIRSISTSPNKHIFLGTTNGAWKFEGSKFIPVGEHDELNNLRINDILFKNDTLILATLGNGIMLNYNGVFKSITTHEGLASNLCNSIYLDKNNLLWVGTTRGLNCIDLKDQRVIRTYTSSTGLASNEVSQIIVLDSLVWTLSNKGLSVLNINDEKKYQTFPQINLQYVKKNDAIHSLSKPGLFEHTQNNIQIGYSGISFQSGKHINYKYRMQGANASWQQTKESKLTYSNLAPGKYTFEVYAQNYRGDWSLKPASYSFTISAPFWKTWWFFCFFILILFLLAKIIFNAKIKSIRKKNLLVQSAFESEQKALQAQLNPHFIFNSLASIQELISSKQYTNATKHLSLVARLIRNTLKNSRTKQISLEQEIDTLHKYIKLEELRFGSNLKCALHLDHNITPETISIPPMMIQPLVENAIWHGIQNRDDKSGTIHVLFQEEGEFLLCSIEDNGVGRKKASELRSKYDSEPLGIQIIQERISLFNASNKLHHSLYIQDLMDENNIPTGTKVTIKFPLN